ncbi:maestro heat-like repeat-containing protein family member 7 isoform X1 [Anas platyrhynchos]|uniref:maestro heat-like repeat-containing protein family member 7 isoform X1 n=1 Tax=Anas platyrhynchos TaxID=8839 RepID=UPI0018D80060|nr:maestro heat-like repeat-containing protein family member 7 isoform X1 [Anas platyrhynchos]
MGECMSCVAPRQNDADDLPLAGLLLVIPKILDAEKDSGSAAYSMWETHVLQRDNVSAVSILSLAPKDMEDYDYFWAVLTGTKMEEDWKLKFLASIRTICSNTVQKRYMYLPCDMLGVEEKMQLPESSSDHLRTLMLLGWQAAYAISERSKENLALLSQHLGPCINAIGSLASTRERGSLDASLYAEILKSLDSVLEVLVCTSSDYTAAMLEIILQALLPFTRSENVAKRRYAVGRIASLSEVLIPSSLMQDSFRNRVGTVRVRTFQTKPVPLLGQLMGCLTLCCAEKDKDISCGSAEALHAFHRIVMVRQSHFMTPTYPYLFLERECPSTFRPKDAANELTVFGSFLFPVERTNFILTILEGMTHPRVSDKKVVARVLDMITDSDMEEVPRVMRIIHDCLATVRKESLLDILKRTLFQITSLHPGHAVQGLLEVFPWCDRVATAMWQTMVSEPCVAEDVLRNLLKQRIGPEHDVFGSPHSCVRSWAVTSAMNKIFQLPSSKNIALLLFHKLYIAVLFQISFIHECTLQDFSSGSSQMGECVWPSGSFLRTAVMTMRALFQHLGGATLVEDIQMQGGWDRLLRHETFHTGVAVLTRALGSKAPLFGASVFEEAVVRLWQRQKHEEITAMAVFTELLDCVDFEQLVDNCIPHLLHSHLRSQSSVLRRMAVTSLVTLSTRPKLAVTLQDLLPEVMQQLQDANSDINMQAMTVLRNTLRLADGQVAGPIALQLPDRLLPLFDNESSCMRELSILLCKDAMEVAEGTHKMEMKKQVHRTVLPLFFHLHDQNQHVAEASREALLGAAKLLKWKQLRNLLETAQPQRIGECLLVGHSSRVDDYLSQSLQYLRSPQEPLQEAAIRFIGLAGQHLVDGREEKLKIIEALRSMEGNSSPSVSSLVTETILVLRTSSTFSLQALRYRLRRVWERRPRVPRAGWLRCCSCAQC